MWFNDASCTRPRPHEDELEDDVDSQLIPYVCSSESLTSEQMENETEYKLDSKQGHLVGLATLIVS